MKHNNKLQKLLKLIYFNEDDFSKYYEKARAKGQLMFSVEHTGINVISILIVSIIFIARALRFYGFEKEDTLLASLIFGLILGIITAPLKWAIDFDRYFQIQKKKNK